MRVDTSKWNPEQKKVWSELPTTKQSELSQQGPEKAKAYVQEQLQSGTMHLRGTVGAGKVTGRADKMRSPTTATPQGDASLASDLMKQLKHAHIPAPQALQEGGQTAPSNGQNNVSSKFHVQIDDISANIPTGNMQTPLDLSSRGSRIQEAQTITQFGGKDTRNEESSLEGCGAAAIVNGAMIQGGQKGLEGLIEVIEDRGNIGIKEVGGKHKVDTSGIKAWGKLDGIKERVKNGNPTRQDLTDLQSIVWEQMRVLEVKEGGAGAKTARISNGIMKQYINTDTSYTSDKRPLVDALHGANIKLINTDRAGDPEHFVLFFNKDHQTGPENAVYDPWPHNDGKQVTMTQDNVLLYHHSVENAIW